MQTKYSSQLYEKSIKAAFSAHAGDDNPDPEAIKEVQKAMVVFVKNILAQATERSSERDKTLEKIYPEDILYVFKDNPKYLDACAKSLLNFQYGSIFSKLLQKNRGNHADFNDQDAFSSKSIERWQESYNE